MPKKCAVPGCESTYPSHQFPRDSSRLRKWQLAINSSYLYSLTNEELTIGRSYCICHLHFSPDSYEETKWLNRRRLKRDAVPTLRINPATSAASSNIRDSTNISIEGEKLVAKDMKAAGVPDSTSKKKKKSHKSKSGKKSGKRIGLKKASRKQRIKDALKLMKTDYFQKLMASRSRADKLYAELHQRKTLQRPSLELMRLCQNVAETCPEYAHEYITNMMIK